MRRPRRLPPLALVALAGCVSTPPPGPSASSLAAALAETIGSGPLAGAQWGILAVDLVTGDTIVAHHPAVRMIPASTQKIAVTVAALDLLGPDHRWETELWATAAPDGSGTVAGDLVLPGTGDPTLSARWWPARTGTPRVPAALAALADSVLAAGVRRVTGALVIDATRWDSTTVRASWMVDDLPFGYAATGGAFAIEEGETRVALTGGAAPGDPVEVAWWPVGEPGFVESRLVTAGARDGAVDVVAAYLPESRRLLLTGTVPPGAVDTLALATRDPVRQAAAALHEALRAAGVDVAGGWRVAWEPEQAPDAAVRLAGLASPPLVAVVEGMLEPSQNWIAEQVVRALGLAEGRAGWGEGAAALVRHATTTVGIDSLDIKVVDGSGLSVQDLLTPRALVALLRHAHGRPWGAAYRSALPEPGEAGGTLEGRLAGLEGRLFAKTGSLTNVAALAGYLESDAGRPLAFAIVVNGSNLPGSRTREAIDRIVQALAAGR